MKKIIERILKEIGIEKIEFWEYRKKKGYTCRFTEQRFYTVGSALEFCKKNNLLGNKPAWIERDFEYNKKYNLTHKRKRDTELPLTESYGAKIHNSDTYVYVCEGATHYICQHWLDWLGGWEFVRSVTNGEHYFELWRVPFIRFFVEEIPKYLLSFKDIERGFMSDDGRLDFSKWCEKYKVEEIK